MKVFYLFQYLVELYSQFKEWFKDSLPNHSVPIKNDIKEYFMKLWGMPEKGYKWKGYRIRTLQDDLINEDSIINIQDIIMIKNIILSN